MEFQGCPGSWAGLAELRPAVRRFLVQRCRDESEAEDIVQEALLRASRYRTTLADPDRLRPWLMRIALNVLRDHVRRERRLPRIEVEPALFERIEGREDVPGEPRVEAQVQLEGALVEKPRALVQLCDAKVSLRDRDRTVLDSYYEAGLSCAETALVCEIPAHLVKVRLFRARRRLRGVLRSRFRVEAEPVFEELAPYGETDGGARCAAGG